VSAPAVEIQPDIEAEWAAAMAPLANGEGSILNVEVDSIEEFAAVDEPGADPLIGDGENILLTEGGDSMMYGDGGAGKTTLAFDAAFHLAAGSDWLGLPVPRRVRSLIIEREGPRPLLRRKMRRKLADWDGPPIDGGVRILRSPWTSFSFADEQWRGKLAEIVEDESIDLIIAGPLTRIGMDTAGTLQEVVAFMQLVSDVRAHCQRRVAVLFVHHENKSGSVSGAWEGAGDTLLHVQQGGPRQTILTVQKARWGSDYHGITMHLAWAPGESFEVAADRDLVAEIHELLSDGTWRTVDEIRESINAGTTAVRDAFDEHSEHFEMRTGERARALGRSPKAQLYQVAS
jgi:hypothetical protein